MVARTRKRGFALVSLFTLIIIATILLNLRSFFFEPLAPLPRWLIPALLAAGALGALLESKVLKWAGWIGVAAFFVLMIASSIPGEDYVLRGTASPDSITPNRVSGWLVLIRLATVSLFTGALVLCFRIVNRQRTELTSVPRD
jgi:hypothetical protein